MIARRKVPVWFVLGMLVFGFLSVAVPVLLIGGKSLSRDAFCYSDYKQSTLHFYAMIGVVGFPLVGLVCFVVARRFAEISFSPCWSLVPLVMSALFVAFALGSELVAIEVSREHCAGGPPELMDNNVPTSEWTPLLFRAATLAAAGYVCSLMALFFFGFDRRPSR